MKILVTGAAGFIGSHIFNNLKNKNYNVFGIDNLLRGKLKNLSNKKNFFKIDLNDKRKLKNFLRKHGPFKLIIHQAALINENIDKEDILKDLNINVLSTINLITNSYKFGTRKIIFASSIAVYGKIEKSIAKENDRLDPLSSYAICKLTIENYLKYYSKYKFKKLQYIILRYSNVYGPKQSDLGEVGVVRKFIQDIKKKKVITKHGSGLQSRDFIHVNDVVEATIKSIKIKQNTVLNICSGKNITVNKIINIFKKFYKKNFKIKKKTFHAGEYFYFKASNALAKKKMNWSPKVNIQKGIKLTIN